jgi:hypothetical protein
MLQGSPVLAAYKPLELFWVYTQTISIEHQSYDKIIFYYSNSTTLGVFQWVDAASSVILALNERAYDFVAHIG